MLKETIFTGKDKIKSKKNIISFLVICSLLLTTIPISISVFTSLTSTTLTIDPGTSSEVTLDAIPFPQARDIRVAIYSEENTSVPSYALGPGHALNNNLTIITEILAANEYFDITIVNTNEIYNHILTTVNFDVLVLIDNLPRENITNMVMEYWLAGGGIISFDSSANFLTYFGILPPESVDDTGYTTYWTFNSDGFKIINRHPIAKGYELDDSAAFTDAIYHYFSWDLAALSASVVGGAITPVAESIADSNKITALAFDPTDRGGRVVTIGYDLDHEVLPFIDQMIRDSIDWLAPKPKGRIAFDLSHHPRLGIDDWDTLTLYPGRYTLMRDYLVSCGFTVDKLYPVPSGDNFTLNRLEPYDMLITVCPDYNYTAGDRASIEEWVAMGGGLLALGENPLSSFVIPDDQLDTLLAPFGMSLTEGKGVTTTFNEFIKHPTTEGCTTLISPLYGYINITDDAYPIWMEGPNIVVAGTEHGAGRVILTSDINWFQDYSVDYLNQESNKNFILNIANWLSASTANVLIYNDWSMSGNYYRSSVALALNDLGVKYHLTYTHDYFNFSLNIQSWDLVILDNPNYFGLDAYFDEIGSYVDSGGHLIMCYFAVDNFPTNPLWEKLGFAFNVDFTNEPPMYLWDLSHDIFNQPHHYDASNFTIGTGFADDGERLTVLPGATALAGYTATEQAGEAMIILGNDGRTLYNSYLIDEYTDDIDDSTYDDAFELWRNEIAFMLRPQLEFVMDIPTEAYRTDSTLPVTVNINNFGLSAAQIGYIDITIPTELGTTTDPLSVVFDIPKGGTYSANWDVQISSTGNFTLSFVSAYQGYLLTSYEASFTFDVSIKLLPMLYWYFIIGGAGGLVLLILIISIIAAVSKKKKKASTR